MINQSKIANVLWPTDMDILKESVRRDETKMSDK